MAFEVASHTRCARGCSLEPPPDESFRISLLQAALWIGTALLSGNTVFLEQKFLGTTFMWLMPFCIIIS